MSVRDLTTDEAVALTVAKKLISAGIPVLVARTVIGQDGQWDVKGGCGGYRLPSGWQNIEPDVRWLDPTAAGFTTKAWRPGWALAAVMGRGLDLLDIDPRNGGDLSREQLVEAGAWPRVYAAASTPSGGTHEFVASMNVGSRDGLCAGFDVKGGLQSGKSRGFAFLPPIVKLSKVTSELAPYIWVGAGTVDALGIDTDDSGRHIAELVRQGRPGKKSKGATAAPVSPMQRSGGEPPVTPGGGRRKQLLSYAGSLRPRRLTLEEATQLMKIRWECCAQPPKADHELPWGEAELLGAQGQRALRRHQHHREGSARHAELGEAPGWRCATGPRPLTASRCQDEPTKPSFTNPGPSVGRERSATGGS